MEGKSDERPAHGDLSQVLKRLTDSAASSRVTEESRRNLANHPLTVEILEAGLRLIARQLAPEEDESPAAPIRGPERTSAFFSWVSFAEAKEVGRGGKLRCGQGALRDRWRGKDDFIIDLLAYALWSRHWQPHFDAAAKAAEPLAGGADLVQAIHEAAYREQKIFLENRSQHLSLITAAISDRYPELREDMSRTYSKTHESWIPVYRETLRARGLALRPDVSFEDIADILSALSEGLGLRMLSDSDSRFIDHERRRSLFGKAVLMILCSAVDIGDGLGLEEVVEQLIASSDDQDQA